MTADLRGAGGCPVMGRLQAIETKYLYSLRGPASESKGSGPTAPSIRRGRRLATRSFASFEPSREVREGRRTPWLVRPRRGAAPRRPPAARTPTRYTGWFADEAFVPPHRVPSDRCLPRRRDREFVEGVGGGPATCARFPAASAAIAKRIAGIRARGPGDTQDNPIE